MIKKLRKKLLVVLMCVVFLFVAFILLSMFISARSDFERRSLNSMQNRPPKPETVEDGASRRGREGAGVPTAVVLVTDEGEVTVIDNQIFYVTDEELTALALELQSSGSDFGRETSHELRYMRRTTEDGTRYFFSDTYSERQALGSQILYSCVIGLLALLLFFAASLLLSRWMVKPVERAWEEQRRFIADASHELKTPLTVILSNTDMLIASGAVSDDKNRARLDNLRAESQRMKGLVESLLSLERSDSGSEPYTMERVNLSYIVSGGALTLESTIYDSGRTLQCDIAEDIMLTGDAKKLRQLVDILLDNACKYSDEGSVIKMTLEQAGKREVRLSVSETGKPLSPEDCENIFKRFYRVDESRGSEQGYGLGLSIAHGIVSHHGGSICATSDGVRTNVFTVKLPLAGRG